MTTTNQTKAPRDDSKPRNPKGITVRMAFQRNERIIVVSYFTEDPKMIKTIEDDLRRDHGVKDF